MAYHTHNRPNKNRTYRPEPREHTKKQSPLPRKRMQGLDRLSPMLVGLLSMASEDSKGALPSMALLEDIYPYVSSEDRIVLGELLGYQSIAKEFMLPSRHNHLNFAHAKKALTNRERMFGLLRTLSKYSGDGGSESLAGIEHYIHLFERISREPSGRMDMSLMPDLFELFSGGQQLGDDMRQMLGLMSMLGNANSGSSANTDMASMLSMLSPFLGTNKKDASEEVSNAGMNMQSMMQMVQMMGALSKNTGGSGGNMDMQALIQMMQAMNHANNQ